MKVVLQIEGMTCAHCVQHVEEALKTVQGVKSVKANLKTKTAVVEHESGVNPAALKAAVEESGYSVKY